MTTKRPSPLAASAFHAYLARRKGLVSRRPMSASQRSSGKSAIGETCWKPAFATTASSRPKRSSAVSTAARFPSRVVRSAANGSPGPVSSGSRSTASTSAPSRSKRSAIARPIPLAAPVTMTARPLKSFALTPRHASVFAMDVVAALRELVSDPARVTDDEAVTEGHGSDISPHAPRPPDAVVFPNSAGEVAEILRWANTERVPIVAYGSGTSVEGQVIPVRGGISLDLSRLNEILAVQPDDLLARVQAGVKRLQLEARLSEDGLFFPVDPGADASIGGMGATNASGTNAVRYGTMRVNTLGLEVVLAGGTVVSTGGPAPKSAAGYDLTRLFVG